MEYFAKLKYVVACVSVAFVLQGCDWVKGQLGMPTSEDVARMKVELQQKEEMEREALKKAAEDSLMSITPAKEVVEGYYVIIGSFVEHSNADALADFVAGMGYSPIKIELKNGYMMVSIGKYATVAEAVAQMRKIEGTEVCPYDVWVYGAAQRLHKEN